MPVTGAAFIIYIVDYIKGHIVLNIHNKKKSKKGTVPDKKKHE